MEIRLESGPGIKMERIKVGKKTIITEFYTESLTIYLHMQKLGGLDLLAKV